MAYFPVMMNIEDKRVLVVGGGQEGKQKVKVLSMFGAIVTVVAKEVSDGIEDIADTVFIREFTDADIEDGDYVLVVAATNDDELNEKISTLSKKKMIPVNVVDNTKLCTFIFPAIIKEGDVVCSVSSGGKSPYLTQYVKKLIKSVLPDRIGKINDTMGIERNKAFSEIEDVTKRRVYLKNKLDELLAVTAPLGQMKD